MMTDEELRDFHDRCTRAATWGLKVARAESYFLELLLEAGDLDLPHNVAPHSAESLVWLSSKVLAMRAVGPVLKGEEIVPVHEEFSTDWRDEGILPLPEVKPEPEVPVELSQTEEVQLQDAVQVVEASAVMAPPPVEPEAPVEARVEEAKPLTKMSFLELQAEAEAKGLPDWSALKSKKQLIEALTVLETATAPKAGDLN